jgi:hypothetical protein
MKDNVVSNNLMINNRLSMDLNFPNEEWLKTGIKILRDEGHHCLTIEKICTALNQSQEQFSQYYTNFAGYISCLLEYWYEKETLSYINAMDEIGGNAEENLMNLIEMVHYADKQDEIAIRNWALKCPLTLKAMAKVDRTRLDVGIGLLKEIGFSEKDSILRARIIYTASIGAGYTRIPASLDQKRAMVGVLIRKN